MTGAERKPEGGCQPSGGRGTDKKRSDLWSRRPWGAPSHPVFVYGALVLPLHKLGLSLPLEELSYELSSSRHVLGDSLLLHLCRVAKA